MKFSIFNKFNFAMSLIILIIILTIGGAIAYPVMSINNVNNYEVTVTDKEAKATGDSTKYLVFAEYKDETKVFQVSDSLFKWRFNSSDVYGSIKVGEEYEFDTIGYRIPFLSEYENIMDVKEK